MTGEQRAALHALFDTRARVADSRWTRRDRGIDIVWASTLALMLALAVTAFDQSPIFLRTADRLQQEAAHREAAHPVLALASRHGGGVTTRSAATAAAP
ncbi:MAG: hypothetical protein ACREX6_06760 [Casimicrobiaceae bacterium]